MFEPQPASPMETAMKATDLVKWTSDRMVESERPSEEGRSNRVLQV